VALSWLAHAAAGPVPATAETALAADVDRSRLALWLVEQDLAPIAFAAARSNDPELAALLKPAAAGAAAGNLAHFATLDRIERRFAGERIPMVLLKGAAVAATAYRDTAFRPMTDLDIWIRHDDMPRAVAQLRALGFRQEAGLTHRPAALQRESRGELVFRDERGGHGLVELHYGAFQGWWVRRVAVPSDEALWERAEPVTPGRHARRLATEDAILQTALHVAVNQFGQAPWRGLMDLAVLARAGPVDWSAVASRARAWRLATAAWLVLDSADRLIGLPGSASALAALRPTRVRRGALRAFVTPGSLLSGRDLTAKSRRHVFMMAIVDRRRDGARLVGRALWPETWWIAARYGRQVSRARHLWELFRRGEV
jgi:hypothetical protein